MMLLNEHGEGRVEVASAEGELIITLMLDAISNWYGRIGVERVVVNGRLTI